VAGHLLDSTGDRKCIGQQMEGGHEDKEKKQIPAKQELV
jgi:hypothetical protein